MRWTMVHETNEMDCEVKEMWWNMNIEVDNITLCIGMKWDIFLELKFMRFYYMTNFCFWDLYRNFGSHFEWNDGVLL